MAEAKWWIIRQDQVQSMVFLCSIAIAGCVSLSHVPQGAESGWMYLQRDRLSSVAGQPPWLLYSTEAETPGLLGQSNPQPGVSLEDIQEAKGLQCRLETWGLDSDVSEGTWQQQVRGIVSQSEDRQKHSMGVSYALLYLDFYCVLLHFKESDQENS